VFADKSARGLAKPENLCRMRGSLNGERRFRRSESSERKKRVDRAKRSVHNLVSLLIALRRERKSSRSLTTQQPISVGT